MYKDTLFANGFVVIKQNKLLDAARVKRMIEAQGTLDTVRVLLDCGYNESIINKEPIDLDLLLEDELKKTVEFFDEFCADSKLLTVCLKKFDYHNAKVFAKAKYAAVNTKEAVYPVGLIGAAELERCVNGKRYEDLPEKMAQALIRVEELFAAGKGSGREIDILLDRAMFSDISIYSKWIKNGNVRKYFQAEADIGNIMIAARSRHLKFSKEETQRQFVEGGKLSAELLIKVFEQGTASILEAFSNSEYADYIKLLCASFDSGASLDEAEGELRELLFNKSRKNMENIFTIEPLFAWYIQKLAEIKTVKLIVVCKNNNINAQSIKKRLRGVYA